MLELFASFHEHMKKKHFNAAQTACCWSCKFNFKNEASSYDQTGILKEICQGKKPSVCVKNF